MTRSNVLSLQLHELERIVYYLIVFTQCGMRLWKTGAKQVWNAGPL